MIIKVFGFLSNLYNFLEKPNIILVMVRGSRAASLITVFCLLIGSFAYAAEQIDINSAPLEDLVKIIHIGEARAQELISLRPFSSLDDLDRIKGIGAKRIEDIKKQGLAWVGSQINSEEVKIIFPPAEKTSVEPDQIKKEPSKAMAAVGEQAPNPSPPIVFLVAAILAVFSGGVIFFLKKRLN